MSAVRAGARARRQAQVGLFVEGAGYTDVRGRNELDLLWRALSRRVLGEDVLLQIVGITKAQIQALQDESPRPGSREPLDVAIGRIHRASPLDVVVVAFDRIPPNDQAVPHSCLRSEVSFVLDRFEARRVIPEPFLSAARALRLYYERHPRAPRGSGRPPRNNMDLLLMDPMFEALFLDDETTVLRALGHGRRPKDWPTFDPNQRNPDQHALADAVRLATEEVRRKVRGDLKSNKHGWARWIIEQAPEEAQLFAHPIAERLRMILA